MCPEPNERGWGMLAVLGPRLPILQAFQHTPGTPLRREVSVAVASLYELGGVSFVVACLGFVPASTLGNSAYPSNLPAYPSNLCSYLHLPI